MEAAKIIRRIDDFGRIAIPKEIRRGLRIKEGDPLEILTTKSGEIIIKPCQEHIELIDDFIKVFREMDITDKIDIVKMLVEEMG